VLDVLIDDGEYYEEKGFSNFDQGKSPLIDQRHDKQFLPKIEAENSEDEEDDDENAD
jgi:hypothetical protein